MEAKQFGLPSFVALEEDGTGCIVGCVNFQLERFVGVGMCQYRFRSENVDDFVQGLHAVWGPLKLCVLF